MPVHAVHALSGASATGEADIFGKQGVPLLRVIIRQEEGRRMLRISMPHPGSEPRASVGPCGAGHYPADMLEIRGPRNSFYGTLELQTDGTYFVVRDGLTMIVIDGQPGILLLALTTADGRPLASVTCGPEAFSNADHLRIRVHPCMDPVLALSCVLAVSCYSTRWHSTTDH